MLPFRVQAPSIPKTLRGAEQSAQISPTPARRAPAACVAIAALLVAWPSASAATTLTVTMTSSHDTTLYGGDDEVGFSDGAGASLFAGNNNQSEPRRALLAFDLARAVPPGSTITSAVLHLVVTRTQLRD